MATNPIEQRIEQIAEQWELHKLATHAPIVRLQCQADEEDMVEAFYTYMLATEGEVIDIAFYFESRCTSLEHYSQALMDELTETMDVWAASKKEGAIQYEAVNWQPDITLQDPKNHAALFIANFNALAAALDLPDGHFAVATFAADNKNSWFVKWLEQAMQLTWHPKVKLLFNDNVGNPYFDSVAFQHRDKVYTIAINLNMPDALEQTAAMGDPTEPANIYRAAYVRFMNRLAKNNEKEAEKAGQECYTIAEKYLAKDPYWVIQLVTIKMALANDKLKHKKKDAAIALASEAVAIATGATIYFKENEVTQLIAQARMFRGTMLFTNDKYADAHEDFNAAYSIYKQNNSLHLAIEAARMGSTAAKKASLIPSYKELLKEGIQLGSILTPEIATSSTYHYLLYEYISTTNDGIMPYNEVEAIGIQLYGQDWVAKVNKATNNYLQYIQEQQEQQLQTV